MALASSVPSARGPLADLELDYAVLPLWVRLRAEFAVWSSRHQQSLLVLVPTLALVAWFHIKGMNTFPLWRDDPGTYLSQSWAFQFLHALSPTSYIYDHPPLGWMQIAVYSMLTGGFYRYDSAMVFGNECMAIAALVCAALMFGVGRRLGLSRLGSAVAPILFGLTPLALTFTRPTYLDNLVNPWLLLALYLALSPRRSIAAGVGASVSFAAAVLTKETYLLALPGLIYAMAQNNDRRNRSMVWLLSALLGVLTASLYICYALIKTELFAAPNRNSLLGTALWQLVHRQSSGSVLDPNSAARQMVTDWLDIDQTYLVAGAAAAVLALAIKRLRPLVGMVLLQYLWLLKGGYVPAMFVLAFLPWNALLIVGVLERVSGNRRLSARYAGLAEMKYPAPAVTRWRLVRIVVAALMAVAIATQAYVPWRDQLSYMTTVAVKPDLQLASEWVGRNVPRDKVIVVHDTIWVDLVQHDGWNPRDVVMAYKLDADPAVHNAHNHVDYLVVPNWYYQIKDGKYPSLLSARDHAIAVATFGSGHDGVTVYMVSAVWKYR